MLPDVLLHARVEVSVICRSIAYSGIFDAGLTVPRILGQHMIRRVQLPYVPSTLSPAVDRAIDILNAHGGRTDARKIVIAG